VKLLFVVNEARFFLSHRLPLGLEALRRGYEVVVVTAPETGEEALAAHGFRHIAAPLTRSGFVLLQEMAAYRTLKQVFRGEQPDLVHQVTIKPVIYGSFAARAAEVRAVVNAVPGMGFVFSHRGVRAALLRGAVNLLYRLAFTGLHMRVIFQNSEDVQAFLQRGILDKQQTVLIRGSGVDLSVYAGCMAAREAARREHPVFVLLARMLRDKGVEEFARAAALLKQQYPQWRFLLAGDIDPGNPSSLDKEQLRRLGEACGVEWQGHVSEVPALLADCDVLVLPSYREGLPKTLLEAAAAGLPMVASDIAGCREVVTEGVTGMLVPPRTVTPLADAMRRLGEDPALRQRLGRAARQKAEAVFGIDDVVEHTFRVYEELRAP